MVKQNQESIHVKKDTRKVGCEISAEYSLHFAERTAQNCFQFKKKKCESLKSFIICE